MKHGPVAVTVHHQAGITAANTINGKERGLVDPGRMVTHCLNFDVEDVNKAYQMYEQQLENVVKVVMSVGA